MTTKSDDSAFVITGRNKEKSIFRIKSKPFFERGLEHKWINLSKTNEKICNEIEIIKMMKERIEFFTYSKTNKTFTKVKHDNGHIKSVTNSTKENNIENLPVIF